MGEYREQDTDIAMGEISTGCEYLPILGDHYITKAQIKAADTPGDQHEPDIIGGFAFTVWV